MELIITVTIYYLILNEYSKGNLKKRITNKQTELEICEMYKSTLIGIKIILRLLKVARPEIFQGRRGLVGFGHFYKHFVKNTRK